MNGRSFRGLDLTGIADDKFRTRFWAKVDKDGPVPAHLPEAGNCWTWTRYVTPAGYGQFTISKGQFRLAHTVSYALTNGPIPPGMHICHRCDNPPCARPDHLFMGTPRDNALDMFAKGRQGPRHPGSERANARLSEDDIRAIRSTSYYYGRTQHLARCYGVSGTTIRRILTGQKWRHVA